MRLPPPGLAMLAALALVAAASSAVRVGEARAQTTGSVRGTIEMGTAGLAVPQNLPVQLIVLAEDGSVDSVDGTAEGSTFHFEVEPDSGASYVVRTIYEGVQYLSQPVLLSPELPDAEVGITVFEPTNERPDLTLQSSTATAIALDRASAQLTLQREDVVQNPTDRVYVGDSDGVTLRLPLPEAVVSAGGSGPEGDYRIEGQTIVTTVPIRPGSNLVVTRYVVSYDPAGDTYALRLTAPLPTERMEIVVPARFIEKLDPLAGAERVDDRTLEGETVRVVALPEAAGAGESVIAELRGLSGRTQANPLTERPGALVAAALAVIVVGGGGLLIARTLERSR